jgi:SAM-dependent methyltransferase
MKNKDLCKRRSTCRLCGGSSVTEAFCLAATPPANAFVGSSSLAEIQEKFPLDVFICEDCAHVQLLDVVDPKLLFENYVYVSGTSPVFVEHFKEYARSICQEYPLKDSALTVDIGSNDGTLLGFFQDNGAQVLGIDPARDIAQRATENGIETWPEFFTIKLSKRIIAERGRASVVTANNMFAHADDLGGILDGIRELLASDGIFAFEVSYLVDVYENTLFDTIYHEHLSYHTVKPLVQFMANHGMRLIEAQRIDTHGGSIRCVACRAESDHPVKASVSDAIDNETRLGLHQTSTLQAYAGKINGLRDELSSLLKKLKSDGKTIAAYGAPAKATTLLYHFDLGADIIDFIVDDSPLKQGLFSPGMHIPVLPSSAIAEKAPDYLLVLAWNFAQPIIKNNAAYLRTGGKFIIPIPKVEIISS